MDIYLRTPRSSTDDPSLPPYYWGQSTNDLIVDSNGDFAVTQGQDCLGQSMAKILTTEQGDNIFFPLYGSQLYSLLGLNVNIDYLRAQVQTYMIDALQTYQYINQANPNLDEQIDTLKSLAINLDPGSNYAIDVSFTVTTRSGLAVGSTINIES